MGMKFDIPAGTIFGLATFLLATFISAREEIPGCVNDCGYVSGIPWGFLYGGGLSGELNFFKIIPFLADLIVFVLVGIAIAKFVRKFVSRTA